MDSGQIKFTWNAAFFSLRFDCVVMETGSIKGRAAATDYALQRLSAHCFPRLPAIGFIVL